MSSEPAAGQDVEKFTSSFSAEQQRELAKRITTFLSKYRHLMDSFIIEFFTEDLWHTLPNSWQPVLQDLSYPQTADLLLSAHAEKRYPSVWPLSLLAFSATAHALAFPRQCSGTGLLRRPKEFLENHSQSSLLGHIFRKHVKPKKQHEIRKLGMLVKQLCDQTGCRRVVDVGSGQGHLSRFLSFGLGLSVTAVEADHALVTMASKFDEELIWTLEKEKQKKNISSQLSKPYNLPKHVAAWVNPKDSWESFFRQIRTSNYATDGVMTPSQPSKKRLRSFDKQGNSHGPSDCYDYQELSTAQGAESSSGNCCSCTQANSEEAGSSEHIRPEGYPDFLLTGLHACGDLSATLLHHFVHCPHVRGITSVACCYMKISTKENPTPPGLVTPRTPLTDAPDSFPSKFGYPMSSWVEGLQGHQLSYKAREGACHATEDYMRRLRDESQQLRSHCYRAMLESFIRDTKPDLRRAGIQTIKKSHALTFTEYARLGLARVGLAPDLPLDPERVEAMMEQQRRVVVYFSLTMLLAPVVETLVLLDRIIYLQENGVDSQLVPLFNPNFSPRNFVLVAMKPSG
uniref:Ribosomal RNA adenine dimethylase domain containing 1 n=1 Tax=Oryzias latipes TaxID=8090 RepID=A0A3P9L3X5_ORYLA